MELGNQIKAHRAALSLSQEELAEKVYVTRQTVSNWETSKSYPDIHSLLLLSALFDVSLDQLIKGDLETMKQEVNAADVKAMNRDAIIYTVLLAATIILPVPLIKWFGLYGLIPELLLWGRRSKRASGPIRKFCSSCSPPGSHCLSAWCSAGCCCKQTSQNPPRRKSVRAGFPFSEAGFTY